MHRWWVVLLGWLLVAASAPAADVILSGAGPTFPYPLYKNWIAAYESATGQRIVYQPVGSGEGIRQLLARGVDFGATDSFLSDEELRAAPAAILHLPTCLGAVVITYNLPGSPEIKFTPDLLAGIFLGEIRDWSDKRLARVNPGLRLPSLPIQVLHRSDGSGTTYIFTEYLSKVSAQWREEVGAGRAVRWPTGAGLDGNARVAEFVQRVNGGIGYIELAYAREHKLPAARLANRAGNFIQPTPQSVSAAAQTELPEDARIMLTDTPSPQGYPISAFSYVICYADQSYQDRSRERAEALARFFWWAIHDGQQLAERNAYAPLPPEAVDRAAQTLRRLNYRGAALLKP